MVEITDEDLCFRRRSHNFVFNTYEDMLLQACDDIVADVDDSDVH